MNKEKMTDTILSAKKKKGMTWDEIAAKVGMNVVWVTSACLGQNKMGKEHAKKLCDALDLDDKVGDALQDYCMKTWDDVIPKDPVVYRFYEMVGVYGTTLKELIHERYGDGIMSAIDFSIEMSKEDNPKGARVVLTLNGKFLPYTPW